LAVLIYSDCKSYLDIIIGVSVGGAFCIAIAIIVAGAIILYRKHKRMWQMIQRNNSVA